MRYSTNNSSAISPTSPSANAAMSGQINFSSDASDHSSESTYPMSSILSGDTSIADSSNSINNSNINNNNIKRKNGHMFQELIRDDESIQETKIAEDHSIVQESGGSFESKTNSSSSWSLITDNSIVCHFCKDDLKTENKALKCSGNEVEGGKVAFIFCYSHKSIFFFK